MFYGDPQDLERHAQVLRHDATELRRQAREQVAHAAGMVWHSLAADACRRQIDADQQRVERVATELDEAAAALTAHADTVRERLAQIAAIERAVRTWFTGQLGAVGDVLESAVDAAGNLVTRVAHRPPPWEGWPVSPYTLPPPGDARWLEIGHFMRQVGVL